MGRYIRLAVLASVATLFLVSGFSQAQTPSESESLLPRAAVAPSVAPPLISNPGALDPRAEALQARRAVLTANITAARQQFEEDTREAARASRSSIEAMERRQGKLRELRAKARDALADIQRLVEDSTAALKRQSEDAKNAYFKVMAQSGQGYGGRVDDVFIPAELSAEELLTEMRRRYRDNEQRLKELEATVAVTPEGEERSRLRSELSGRRGFVPLESAEQGIRSAVAGYERLRIGYHQIETQRAEAERLRLEAERLGVQLDSGLFALFANTSEQNQFRETVTLYFAGLILLVIVGFFVLVGIDQSVREKIFGGESGIQFVTLFALVIAVILFGVMGILEGKELAALLGGLSGYILGRGVTPRPA